MNQGRIILIGFMGAGKTRRGKALSITLVIAVYDLDWYIENRMHKTIKQLFDERGEEGFRKIEHAMLHEVQNLRMSSSAAAEAHPASTTTWRI